MSTKTGKVKVSRGVCPNCERNLVGVAHLPKSFEEKELKKKIENLEIRRKMLEEKPQLKEIKFPEFSPNFKELPKEEPPPSRFNELFDKPKEPKINEKKNYTKWFIGVIILFIVVFAYLGYNNYFKSPINLDCGNISVENFCPVCPECPVCPDYNCSNVCIFPETLKIEYINETE